MLAIPAEMDHVLDEITWVTGAHLESPPVVVLLHEMLHHLLIDGPPGAQVWVEGTLIGETPLPKISAEIGEREVVVIHPEAGEIRETVMVDSESPAVLTLGPAEPAN
jgi:hypothetical protein